MSTTTEAVQNLDLDRAYTRLLKTKQAKFTADHYLGFEKGRVWAIGDEEAEGGWGATFDELSRLAKFKSDSAWHHIFTCDEADRLAASYDQVAQVMRPGDDEREFWEDALGDDSHLCEENNRAFLKGFCEGALGIFESVRDKLGS